MHVCVFCGFCFKHFPVMANDIKCKSSEEVGTRNGTDGICVYHSNTRLGYALCSFFAGLRFQVALRLRFFKHIQTSDISCYFGLGPAPTFILLLIRH